MKRMRIVREPTHTAGDYTGWKLKRKTETEEIWTFSSKKGYIGIAGIKPNSSLLSAKKWKVAVIVVERGTNKKVYENVQSFVLRSSAQSWLQEQKREITKNFS